MTAPQDLCSPPREGCALCPLPRALTPWPLFQRGRGVDSSSGSRGRHQPRSGSSRASRGTPDQRPGQQEVGRDGVATWRKGCWKLCSLLPPQPWATKLSAHLQWRDRRSSPWQCASCATLALVFEDKLAPLSAKRPVPAAQSLHLGSWTASGALETSSCNIAFPAVVK